MYKFSSFKDGLNICLEVATPFEKKFKVFPTYAGYKEYLHAYLWHLDISGKEYEVDELEVV